MSRLHSEIFVSLSAGVCAPRRAEVRINPVRIASLHVARERNKLHIKSIFTTKSAKNTEETIPNFAVFPSFGGRMHNLPSARP